MIKLEKDVEKRENEKRKMTKEKRILKKKTEKIIFIKEKLKKDWSGILVYHILLNELMFLNIVSSFSILFILLLLRCNNN